MGKGFVLALAMAWAALSATAQNLRWIKPGGTPAHAAVGGGKLATADHTGLIHVWELENGPRFLKTLPGEDVPLMELHVSTDGRTVVAVLANLHRRAWRIHDSTGWDYHYGRFDATAYQPRSNRLATINRAQTMHLADVQTQQPAGSVELDVIGAPRFGPDDDLLAFAVPGGAAIRKLSTGLTLQLRPRASIGIPTIAFSRDGQTLGMDIHQSNTDTNLNSVILWNAQTGQMARSLHGADGSNGLAFSPDGSLVATVDAENRVVVWNVASDAVIYAGPAGENRPIVFLDNARLLAGREIVTVATGGAIELTTGHGVAHNLSFSADGSLLASGTHIFETGTGRVRSVLRRRDLAMASASSAPRAAYVPALMRQFMPLQFTANDTQLRAGGYIYDVETGWDVAMQLGTYPFAFGPGTFFATGGDMLRDIAHLRRYSDGEVIRALDDGDASGSRAIAISASGNRVAAGGSANSPGGTIRIFNANDGSVARRIPSRVLYPHLVDFSADEKVVLAAEEVTGGRKAGVYDAATARPLVETQWEFGTGRAIAADLIGSEYLVAGYDGLQVWDLGASNIVARLNNEMFQVASIAVSPDGTKLAAGRLDGTILLAELQGVQEFRIIPMEFSLILHVETRQGMLYTVETSPDLRTWTEYWTFTGNGGTLQRQLPDATAFYRIR